LDNKEDSKGGKKNAINIVKCSREAQNDCPKESWVAGGSKTGVKLKQLMRFNHRRGNVDRIAGDLKAVISRKTGVQKKSID